jgi:glycosyltransferase involved in cell wall biosynthesis
MKPFYSIIIPTLNEEKNLPILLQNLAAQTFTDFEVIHVDANSEDKTIEKAKIFADKFTIQSKVVTKRNVCYQRNTGAKLAKGKWLLFMDSDDQIAPNFLEECKMVTTKKKLDVFIPFYNPDINKLSYYLLTAFANTVSLLTKNSNTPFITEALLGITAEAFNKVGGFNEKIKVHEGSEFVLTAKKHGYKYGVISHPKYLNSMRRAETMGVFKLLKNNLIIALKILSGKTIDESQVKDLYKMDGGTLYKKETKN